MDKWQPIETAPRDGTWVLLYHKYARVSDWYFDGAKWTNDNINWGDDADCSLSPTHWVPLPAPPQEDDTR